MYGSTTADKVPTQHKERLTLSRGCLRGESRSSANAGGHGKLRDLPSPRTYAPTSTRDDTSADKRTLPPRRVPISLFSRIRWTRKKTRNSYKYSENRLRHEESTAADSLKSSWKGLSGQVLLQRVPEPRSPLKSSSTPDAPSPAARPPRPCASRLDSARGMLDDRLASKECHGRNENDLGAV